MRLFEAWAEALDLPSPSADESSSTPESAAAEGHDILSRSRPQLPRRRRRGLRFCCFGRCILPGPADTASAVSAAVALAVCTLLWVATVLVQPLAGGYSSAPFIYVGVALGSLTWLLFLALIGSDPGILPRHFSALPRLTPNCGNLRTPPTARDGPPLTTDLTIERPPASLFFALGRRGGEGEPPPGVQEACKFCVTCRVWRPPGAHHCGLCDSCVDAFDHHCGVLGKCVGGGNMRLFLQFLWSATLTASYLCIFAVAAAAEAVTRATEGNKTTDAAQIGHPDVEAPPSAWVRDEVQTNLWSAGGVLFGLLLCCSCLGRGMRIWCRSACGAFGIVLILVVGVACFLAAFVRGAEADGGPRAGNAARAAVPPLVGLPLYLYALVFLFGMAMSQSCLVATQMTTKRALRGEIPGVAELSSSSSSAAAAAAAATSATSADITPRSPIPVSLRLANVFIALLAPAPPRAVDFSADVNELRALVMGVERELFRRAEERAAILAANPSLADSLGGKKGKGGTQAPPPPGGTSERPPAFLSTWSPAGLGPDGLMLGAVAGAPAPAPPASAVDAGAVRVRVSDGDGEGTAAGEAGAEPDEADEDTDTDAGGATALVGARTETLAEAVGRAVTEASTVLLPVRRAPRVVVVDVEDESMDDIDGVSMRRPCREALMRSTDAFDDIVAMSLAASQRLAGKKKKKGGPKGVLLGLDFIPFPERMKWPPQAAAAVAAAAGTEAGEAGRV
jgi:hypothetical protein